MSRKVPTLVMAVVLALGAATPLRAIELSHYFAGLPNIDDFFLPAPEVGQVIYGQYNLYYETDTFRNSKGKKVKSITIKGPLGNPRTIKVDPNVDNFIIAPLLMWAPDWEILGARYGAFAILPVGNPSIAADLETEIGLGRKIDESSWGVGDLFLQPLWLQWSDKRLDVTAAYGINAPTGKYDAGDADNVGLGFWEHQIQSALRVHLDEAKTFSVVVAGTAEFGHNKEDVDVVPGSHATLNWGVRKNFLNDWLQVAAVGYDTWQITNDHGSDAGPQEKRVKDQVHAAGVQVGIPKFGLAFKYLHEFEAEDRFEGQMFTLFFALPLDPVIAWVQGA